MKRIKMIKNSRAQHETVGFVLIIIIVAIIGLVFLWFLLRAPATLTDDAQVSKLLESSMYFTTNCSVTYVPNYKTGEDLIKNCYKTSNELCDDGRTFCSALNDSFKSILSQSLKPGENSPIKAYKLIMYYNTEGSETPNKEFLSFVQGRYANCTSRYGGSHSIYLGSGNIEVKLEICEGS